MIFSNYKRLLPYSKPFRLTFALAVILNSISAFFYIVVFVALIPAMQVLLGVSNTSGAAKSAIPTTNLLPDKQALLDSFKQYFLQGTKEESLLKVCVFIFIAYGLKNIFQYFGNYLMSLVEGGMSKTLRDAVFEKLATLSLDYYYDRRTGQLLQRVTDDVGVTNTTITSSITTLIREPLTAIGFVITLFWINSTLALIGLGIAASSILLINFLGKSIKRYAQKVQENIGGFMSVAQEMVTGIKVVKSFGMENYEVGRFKEETRKHFIFSRRLTRIRQTISPLNEMLAILGFIGILWFGGHDVFAKAMDGADLFFFLIALIALMQPVRAMSEVVGKLHEGSAAADNVFSVLDAIPSVMPGILEAPPAITSPIQFGNVSFQYKNSGEEALDHVTIDIQPNEVLALVGPSGAGKTTFVDLLARFYDPTDGKIVLGGFDIKDYDLVSLRKLFGIVTQDTILFHDTIYNNIAYGNRNATAAMIEEAARAANAHDFILSTPKGYDTITGDRGVRLSGGQRQRIAIARALLKNPPILIFDEATSALDTENEMLVQEAIDRLLQQRTAVVIAHRLSTIQKADRIAVFDKGRIVEVGTHDELLEKTDGVYHRLYMIQMRAASEGLVSVE
ncbi:MAG: ABC transporter ATP-binding protein [Bacteroidota bacterium]|nr:ABC transporter ATP-binding protein [Bacteroidota bacterium]